jgi:hypothetical protein
LTAAERLKQFLEGIEAYITAKNITPTKFNPEFALAETLSLESLEKLTQDECFGYAYQLMQYVDHVGRERAQCENVIRWCENSLQSIISELLSSGVWDTYAKHETKVATILRNDDLLLKEDLKILSLESITLEGKLTYFLKKVKENELRRYG